jgi:hypothetical protein
MNTVEPTPEQIAKALRERDMSEVIYKSDTREVRGPIMSGKTLNSIIDMMHSHDAAGTAIAVRNFYEDLIDKRVLVINPDL